MKAEDWISVKDKLPEDDKIVLIVALTTKDEEYIFIGRHRGRAWSTPRVTHWQPIVMPNGKEE